MVSTISLMLSKDNKRFLFEIDKNIYFTKVNLSFSKNTWHYEPSYFPSIQNISWTLYPIF